MLGLIATLVPLSCPSLRILVAIYTQATECRLEPVSGLLQCQLRREPILTWILRAVSPQHCFAGHIEDGTLSATQPTTTKKRKSNQ